MHVHTEDDLDQIYASFYEDRRSVSPRPLTSWISEHPTLKSSLIQWATELPALEIAESRPAYPEFEARSVAIGQAVLRKIGLAYRDVGELTSLNEAARARGMSPRVIAQRLGIGITIFAKLNRRLIHAASVPARLIETLSGELQVSVEELRGYLRQQPTLAQGAAYRADSAPETSDPEEFADAVRRSPDMSEEQKREWVA